MKKNILTIVSVFLLAGLLLAGCGGSGGQDADLSAVMADIQSEITLPESMADLSAADLESMYNIQSAEYTQFAGKVTNIGILGDEIVMVQAASDEAATAIKEKMDARYQSKLNEMKDYLPDEYDKINGGRVVQNGRYVALLVSADQTTLEDIYTKAVG